MVRKVVITCNVFIERFLPCKIAAKQVGHGCSWNMMDIMGIEWYTPGNMMDMIMGIVWNIPSGNLT